MLDGARIFHVNVNCSDLDRSLAFYVDGCGLTDGVTTTPEDRQPGVAFGLEWARWDAHILVGHRTFDGGAIDLLAWKEPPPTGAPPASLHQTGFQRIALQVTSLDATLARLRDLDGNVRSDPTDLDLGGGLRTRLAFVSDPDGTAVELIEGEAHGVAFVAVVAGDLERSVAFYTGLGFTELTRFEIERPSGATLGIDGPVSMREVLLDAPGHGEVRLLLVGFRQPTADAQPPRPANALGMWRTALLVPDLGAAVTDLGATGAALLSEPQSMSMGPGLPELRFVCFRGPDHEVVELIEQPVLD